MKYQMSGTQWYAFEFWHISDDCLKSLYLSLIKLQSVTTKSIDEVKNIEHVTKTNIIDILNEFKVGTESFNEAIPGPPNPLTLGPLT